MEKIVSREQGIAGHIWQTFRQMSNILKNLSRRQYDFHAKEGLGVLYEK